MRTPKIPFTPVVKELILTGLRAYVAEASRTAQPVAVNRQSANWTSLVNACWLSIRHIEPYVLQSELAEIKLELKKLAK